MKNENLGEEIGLRIAWLFLDEKIKEEIRQMYRKEHNFDPSVPVDLT